MSNPEDLNNGPDPAEDSEEEDGFYENPGDLIQEFGTHPLMERAQKALTKQLKETQFRLQVELVEKEDDLKKSAQDREALGVQLYSLQQQLARIQITLENSHNEYSSIVDARLQEEEILREISKNNNEQNVLLSEHNKQQKKYSEELDSLNETIQQIEKYSEEVKAEIALTRRATYKAEQSMQQMEKKKEHQDGLVNHLNKQNKSLQEQISLHTGQLDSQKKETTDANTVLQDTVRELNLISHEKKQLMIQWKASLSGLSRRDEAWTQAAATLANAESAVHDYDVEIDAAKREIQASQTKHESLVNLRDRLENELSWVEESLTKIRGERDILQERFTLLSKSLSQTDSEAKKLDIIAKQLGSDAEALLQNLQIVTQERQKVEEAIQTAHSTHSNVNKAVVNLRKEQSKLLKKIHDKENEANEIENEIARTKVDRLNVASLIDQLKEQHNVAMKELKDKESMISKYQLEIRQRNDEVEKKMYRVDRLNKKYERLVESAGGDEESLGPLENTIRMLNKESELTLEECKELERDWLKKQTEMVGISSEGDNLADANNEYQARVTILSQQQLRLSKDLRSLKTEVKVSNQANIDLQKDVAKLNILISSNHEEEGLLQTSNYIIEKDCVEELKQMERDSVALQATITENKTTKMTLSDEIMEMERQALLWEKKIQLDKETREALDPSLGQQESQSMEREIHRMSLRYEALQREQERLSGEMERAIQKRASIAHRYKGKPSSEAKSNDKISNLTEASIKKRIGTVKKEARIHAEEISRYMESIEEKKASLHEMISELERTTSDYGSTEELTHSLQGDINDLLYQKQLSKERVAYRLKFSKRLKDLTNVGIDLTQSLPIERRLLSATQALENVKEIIGELQADHPHLNDVLERVNNMTDPTITFNI
jgi:chromosome segregation ATPase